MQLVWNTSCNLMSEGEGNYRSAAAAEGNEGHQ